MAKVSKFLYTLQKKNKLKNLLIWSLKSFQPTKRNC